MCTVVLSLGLADASNTLLCTVAAVMSLWRVHPCKATAVIVQHGDHFVVDHFHSLSCHHQAKQHSGTWLMCIAATASLLLHAVLHVAFCFAHFGPLFLQGPSEQGPHQSAQLQPQPPLLKAKRLRRAPAAARVQPNLGQSSQGRRMVLRPATMTRQQHSRLQLLASKQLPVQRLLGM